MRIQIISDVHLEFGRDLDIHNAGADVLVLAGDVMLAKEFKRPERTDRNLPYYRFLDRVCERFDRVVYIMGNHEHYRSVLNDTTAILRRATDEYSNLCILDDETVDIGGYRFVGTTLWTDMNKSDPLTMNHLSYSMNDFGLIKYRSSRGDYYKLSPMQLLYEHDRHREFLERELSGDGPYVVVTHHCPSIRSVHEKYREDYHNNGAYYSDMEYLMTDRVPLWIHGHTHTPFDYTVGSTRVVCNPRGYPGERSDVNESLVVEV